MKEKEYRNKGNPLISSSSCSPLCEFVGEGSRGRGTRSRQDLSFQFRGIHGGN